MPPKVDRAQLLADRAEGLTNGQIAARRGIHINTVRAHIGGNQKAGRPRGGSPADDAETAAMWRLWVSGVPQRKIGEQFPDAKGKPKTQAAVSQRLSRYRAALPATERETVFRRELDLLDDLRRQLLTIAFDASQPAYERISAMRQAMVGMERLSKMLGLDAADERDERRVRLEERHVDLLDAVLRRVLVALGLNPEADDVREVVHRELSLVADNSAA